MKKNKKRKKVQINIDVVITINTKPNNDDKPVNFNLIISLISALVGLTTSVILLIKTLIK